jgi:hypothetical protein
LSPSLTPGSVLSISLTSAVTREIDTFVEKLKATIEFFQGLVDDVSVDAKDSGDFVPFI